MKTLSLFAGLCLAISTSAQTMTDPVIATSHFSIKDPVRVTDLPAGQVEKKDVQIHSKKWKISGNHLVTGGLVFLAGASKGFNETLQFHWKEFHRQFPKANPQWYNPAISWRNKYKNGDPSQGPKSFLSTSVLIMFTDQYHLNNFISKMSWGTAIVVKLGEGKKSFKHYLLDFLYYAVCYQAGFAATYYPFSKYKGK